MSNKRYKTAEKNNNPNRIPNMSNIMAWNASKNTVHKVTTIDNNITAVRINHKSGACATCRLPNFAVTKWLAADRASEGGYTQK